MYSPIALSPPIILETHLGATNNDQNIPLRFTTVITISYAKLAKSNTTRHDSNLSAKKTDPQIPRAKQPPNLKEFQIPNPGREPKTATGFSRCGKRAENALH